MQQVTSAAEPQRGFCAPCYPKIAMGRRNAATATSLSVSTIDRETKAGLLRPSRAFGRPLYLTDDLIKYTQPPQASGMDPEGPRRKITGKIIYALSRVEAADALDISVRSFDRAVQRGLIRGKRIGRRLVFAVNELQRFVRETR